MEAKYIQTPLTAVKKRKVVKRKEFNITKLSKRAVLRHLVVRFLKDYQMDILCVAVALEFTYIIVKSI